MAQSGRGRLLARLEQVCRAFGWHVCLGGGGGPKSGAGGQQVVMLRRMKRAGSIHPRRKIAKRQMLLHKRAGVVWRFALVIRRHWNLFCKDTFGELLMHPGNQLPAGKFFQGKARYGKNLPACILPHGKFLPRGLNYGRILPGPGSVPRDGGRLDSEDGDCFGRKLPRNDGRVGKDHGPEPGSVPRDESGGDSPICRPAAAADGAAKNKRKAKRAWTYSTAADYAPLSVSRLKTPGPLPENLTKPLPGEDEPYLRWLYINCLFCASYHPDGLNCQKGLSCGAFPPEPVDQEQR